MNDAQKEELREKIHLSISAMEKEILKLEEATKPIAPENSIGRISRMDAINNKSVAEASLRSARKKMTSLKMARSKIESPNFGRCSRCGNPINIARLMFLPESDKCIRCADR